MFLSLSVAKADLSNVRNFAFGLGVELNDENLEKLSKYDLVIIDGEDAEASMVTFLKDHGVIVLAYLSAGTIEKGRSWFKKVKPYRLELWQDWGEWYADVSNKGFRKVLVRNIAPMILEKGFDGLFLDNTDMIATHRSQKRGMIKLVKALSELVKKESKFLFTQNGDRTLKLFQDYLDGWNREDVSMTYNFRNNRYKRVSDSEREKTLQFIQTVKEKLLVTTADYVLDGDVENTEFSVLNSCGVGALPFVSNIDLSTLPDVPFSCTTAP